MITVSLGEVAAMIMGQAPPGNECNKEGRGTIFVKAGEFNDRYPVVKEWTTRPLKIARSSDVLVCVVGATAGKISASIDCAIGRSVAAVRPQADKLCTDFLYHFLSTQTHKLRAQSQGLAQGVITREMLNDISLPLPPLDEQQRIAALLDQADDLRRKRREAIKQFARLKESVFIAEFVGHSAYPNLPLSQVCELITDGTHYTPTYAESGTIFLSAKNVTSKKIDWDDVKYIPDALHLELRKRVAPRLNDILLAKNGTTGVAAIVDRDVTFDIYVSLALLRAGPRLLPSYLLAAVNSQNSGRQFSGALKGIGVSNLHLTDIRSTMIPVPPLDVQREFSEQLAGIERLEVRQFAQLAKLDALFASLQHRAFRGEL